MSNVSNDFKRVCVFCGSSNGTKPEYMKAAKALGVFLAERNVELVYGGASVGLMGIVADAALDAGGRVIGIIPEALSSLELAHQGLSELITVTSMHERKAKMASISDGFITLPGGAGTMDEFFEIWTWAQLGLHQKPVGLLNVGGFYDSLNTYLDTMVGHGFLRDDHKDMIIIEESIPNFWLKMKQYVPARDKWRERHTVVKQSN